VTPTPAFEPGSAGNIAREVSEARELIPRWEVPLSLLDEYELSVALYRRYGERPPFPLSERGALRALDLWPEEGLAHPDPVTQAAEAAALYFPEEGQLYLRKDWTGSDEVRRALVAYGYAQALPDQYGDLARLEESSSLDRALALKALAYGDALISLWRYADAEPGTPQARELLELVAEATLPPWRNADDTLARLTRMPLLLGRDFALSRYEAGGLAALDEVLRRPPRSTEQLLHPEHYAESATLTPFDPLPVELEGSWQLTATETVGEALMGFALANWAAQADITEPVDVEGWDGDLLQSWSGPQGARVQLWQTAWDSGREASEFAAQMRNLLPTRLRGRAFDTTAPAGLPRGQWWAGRRGAAFLHREADRVWLVWGTDVGAVEAVGGSLP
jgi:hypothetical protein